MDCSELKHPFGLKAAGRCQSGGLLGSLSLSPFTPSLPFPGLMPVQRLAARGASVHPWHLKLLPRGSRRLQWEEESVVGKHREPSGPKHHWHRSSVASQPPCPAQAPPAPWSSQRGQTSAQLCWGSWQSAAFYFFI